MKRQKGAAIVEFSLVLPVLLVLIFGIVQFAWWMSSFIILQSAASVGARQMSLERGFSTPHTDAVNAIQSVTSTLKNSMSIVIYVGGAECQDDSSCSALLGTITQPPAAGTQTAVSLTYTSTPLFSGSLGGLGSMLPTSQTTTTSALVQ